MWKAAAVLGPPLNPLIGCEAQRRQSKASTDQHPTPPDPLFAYLFRPSEQRTFIVIIRIIIKLC